MWSRILLIAFIGLFSAFQCILYEERREEKNQESSDLHEGDELGIPDDALIRLNDGFLMKEESEAEKKRKDSPPKYEDDRSLCYCNYPSEFCGGFENFTCLKHLEAACFHFTEEIYNRDLRQMETFHLYGCAPLTRGSNGSYFTCNAYLTPHASPKSIACCYEGSYCNFNLTVPPYRNVSPEGYIIETIIPSQTLAVVIIFLAVCCFAVVVAVIIWFQRKYFAKKLRKATLNSPSAFEKTPFFNDISSGSGSGFASLNQRTVAQNLHFGEVIGKGRYGEVWKAIYRGDRFVAVKTFYTTEEDSWRNEKEIYQTQMLNHENILQFVAADIGSIDSITRMLLITDYHEYGSLHEYLNRGTMLSVKDALSLAYSSACGIEHLHSSLRGTGATQKPAIAHRDIKSKNIIVKRPHVCCIADFGLALSEDMLKKKVYIKMQTGTKRYMAPEILDNSLNTRNFQHFLMADIYSFALVMWEILKRVQKNTPLDEFSSTSSGIGSSLSANGNSYSGKHNNFSIIEQKRCQENRRSSEESFAREIRQQVEPFEGLVGPDPSFEEMRHLICIKKVRPKLEDSWTKDPYLSEICELIQECWNENTECRHTAFRIKRKINETLKNFGEDRLPVFLENKSTFDADLGR